MLTAADGLLLAAFAAVARHGSFSAAAAELKLSKSVVSERVRQLEDRCGARLLERTTRRVRLTAAGAEALDAATRVEEALSHLSRSLDAGRREPSGALRISTTYDLGPLLVAPVAARLVTVHPRVRVEILAEDTPRDVLESGIDVAVRLGAPRASSFVARKLAAVAEPIVAAPALAETLAHATRPDDLGAAPWVRHSLVSPDTLRFTGPDGASADVTPAFRAQANTGAGVLALLLHGAGVGVLPEHALREHLDEGRLVRLCAGWIWKQVTLYALLPSRSLRRPAVEVFLSMLRDQIARDAGRWGG